MGKITGLYGSVTGKIGNVVFSQNSGTTVARQYQPNVKNPSTIAQSEQRAKLKLMSQVSAALAPVIAIQKDGMKSSRNLFIKRNFGYAMSESGVASVTYENLQLTSGSAGLPSISATRSAADGIQISLSEAADSAVSIVVYVLFKKTSENVLQYVDSAVVETAGDDGKFAGTLPYVAGDAILYAYGMKSLNATAAAKYQNYGVSNAEDIAKLVFSRNLSASDYQFTQTRGTTLFEGESETTNVPDGSARVFVTANGSGSVSGAGVFEIGKSVTVTATPTSTSSFQKWCLNGSTTAVSTSATYTFTLQQQTDLVAYFVTTGDGGGEN